MWTLYAQSVSPTPSLPRDKVNNNIRIKNIFSQTSPKRTQSERCFHQLPAVLLLSSLQCRDCIKHAQKKRQWWDKEGRRSHEWKIYYSPTFNFHLQRWPVLMIFSNNFRLEHCSCINNYDDEALFNCIFTMTHFILFICLENYWVCKKGERERIVSGRHTTSWFTNVDRRMSEWRVNEKCIQVTTCIHLSFVQEKTGITVIIYLSYVSASVSLSRVLSSSQ